MMSHFSQAHLMVRQVHPWHMSHFAQDTPLTVRCTHRASCMLIRHISWCVKCTHCICRILLSMPISRSCASIEHVGLCSCLLRRISWCVKCTYCTCRILFNMPISQSCASIDDVAFCSSASHGASSAPIAYAAFRSCPSYGQVHPSHSHVRPSSTSHFAPANHSHGRAHPSTYHR